MNCYCRQYQHVQCGQTYQSYKLQRLLTSGSLGLFPYVYFNAFQRLLLCSSGNSNIIVAVFILLCCCSLLSLISNCSYPVCRPMSQVSLPEPPGCCADCRPVAPHRAPLSLLLKYLNPMRTCCQSASPCLTQFPF